MTDTATLSWREADRRHHLHPFTDSRSLHRKGVRVMTRGEGVYVWDSEGNRLLDGMAGLWCVNLGYGRSELVDAAARQMRELPYYNTFFGTATVPAIALAERLSELTPAGLSHVYFANSGSEANETAIKAVRFYWQLKGHPDKRTIISRRYSYHGVTMATASLSGLQDMHPQAGLPLRGLVEHIEAPYWYCHGGDQDPEEYGRQAALALERKILELGADKVAAFIGEPVYGAGGVMVPPQSYWPEINRICKRYDILLIADEVVCGFGRTGRWFGSDTFAIEPDFMTLAKGLSSGYLPISALMVRDHIAETIIEHGGEWVHGFTYSGHPTACAVALENLRILEQEKVVETVAASTGPYFQRKLRELLDHPLVGEVRGVGMVAAIELVENKQARRSFDPRLEVGKKCREYCFANGIIMRAARDCMVTAPPLIISKAEIDELVGVFAKCLDLTFQALNE